MSHTLFDAVVYFKIWAMLKILTFPSLIQLVSELRCS